MSCWMRCTGEGLCRDSGPRLSIRAQPGGADKDMAKAKMKQVVIPKFSSEAKEAEWWDAHRSEIETEIRQRMKQKRPLTLGNLLREAKPSQPITLRIPKETWKPRDAWLPKKAWATRSISRCCSGRLWRRTRVHPRSRMAAVLT